jgi:hypothetical protein
MSKIFPLPPNQTATLVAFQPDTTEYNPRREFSCSGCAGRGVRAGDNDFGCIYCEGSGARADEIRFALIDAIAEKMSDTCDMDVSWHRYARAVLQMLESNGLDVLTMRVHPAPDVLIRVHEQMRKIASTIEPNHPAEANRLSKLSIEVRRLECWADDVVAEAVTASLEDRL